MAEQIFDLKFPRFVLYDTESLKILIATDHIENIHDWLISTKMETVTSQFSKEIKRLEELELQAEARNNREDKKEHNGNGTDKD